MDSGFVPLPHFPEEIWDLIIRQLDDDPKTLAAIRRVNKQLNRIVLPSVFFKRIFLRNSKEGAFAIKRLIDSAEFAGHVQELEFQISQPDKVDLNESQIIHSRKQKPARVSDLGKILEHVLFGPNSEQFFRCLEKISIRFPGVYHHTAENPKYTFTYYEGTNIFQLYRHSTCMYLKMLMRLISRWLVFHETVVQEPAHKNLRPITMEYINFSSHHRCALEWENASLPSVKHLQIGLCPGQVFRRGVKLQTPLHIQTHWSDFRSGLVDTLRDCFTNVETVHVLGWWDQCRYRYLQHISDMSMDSSLLNQLSMDPSRITNITLENLVLYKPRFSGLVGAAQGTIRTLKLKNCILATGERHPDDSRDLDGWVKFFDRWPVCMEGTHFRLCIESADGVEGHRSAFMYAKYKQGEQGDFRTPKLSTPWKEADVQYENGAVEAYWELQKLRTTQGTAS